jgi:hypothetical protein
VEALNYYKKQDRYELFGTQYQNIEEDVFNFFEINKNYRNFFEPIKKIIKDGKNTKFSIYLNDYEFYKKLKNIGVTFEDFRRKKYQTLGYLNIFLKIKYL